MSKSNITNKEIERKTVNFRKKLQESFKVPNPLIKSLSPEANLKKIQQLRADRDPSGLFHEWHSRPEIK